MLTVKIDLKTDKLVLHYDCIAFRNKCLTVIKCEKLF